MAPRRSTRQQQQRQCRQQPLVEQDTPMADNGPTQPLGDSLAPTPAPDTDMPDMLPASLDAVDQGQQGLWVGQWREFFDEQLSCILDEADDLEVRCMSTRDREIVWHNANVAFADMLQRETYPAQRELGQWLRPAVGLREGSYGEDGSGASSEDTDPLVHTPRRSARKNKGRCSAGFAATHGTCMGFGANQPAPDSPTKQQLLSQPQPATPSEPPLRPASRRKGRRR